MVSYQFLMKKKSQKMFWFIEIFVSLHRKTEK